MPLTEPHPSEGPATGDMGRTECLALLGQGGVGRVAVSIGAIPAVFPVHYAMLDGDVVFRTGGGTPLDAAVRDTVVAFEVDDVNPPSRPGWSVLVVGTAGDIAEASRQARAERLPLQGWARGTPERVVAIRPELISGRHIAHRPNNSASGAAHGGGALRP